MAVWMKDEERQYIVKKIADLLEESYSVVGRSQKSPDDMEKAIFDQAKSKEEYMSMAGRLLVSIKQEGLQAQMSSSIKHSGGSGNQHPGIHSGNIQSSSGNDIQQPGSGNIQSSSGNDIQQPGSGNIQSSAGNDIQHPDSGNIQTPGDGGVTLHVHSGQHTNGDIQPPGIDTLEQPVSTSQMATGNLSVTDRESCYVTLVTCPSIEVAKTLSRGVVENKLAACVNIVPQVISIYEWEGKIEEEQELLMIIKSSNSKLKILASYIDKNHPYDVPEVISMKIEDGSTSYLDWIRKTCSPTT